MKQPHWTRLETSFLASVKKQYKKNKTAGCHYHNWEHICSCYKYLADTDVPYDESLDFAVLFHDVVYDHLPEKELRSAELALKMIDKIYKNKGFGVKEIIMGTVNHSVTAETNWQTRAMIRADLSALGDPTCIEPIKNFAKIASESLILYQGLTVVKYCENTISFMHGLLDRVMGNIETDPENRVFYRGVADGIVMTMNISETMRQRLLRTTQEASKND